MPGIAGDWAHFNITCEACHGPGAAHAAKPVKTNVKIDTSVAPNGSSRDGDPERRRVHS